MDLLCNHSVFMVPFTFDNEVEVRRIIESPNSIWREANLAVEKNVLYSHIQDYLQANANEKTRNGEDNDGKRVISQEQDYRIYSLKRAFMCEENLQLHKVLKAWEFFTGQQFKFPKVESSFSFAVNRQENVNNCMTNVDCMDDELYHPTLILWPYAHVGVLLFSVQLAKKKGFVAIEDLMNFNYLFRKTDKNATECQFPFDVVANKFKNLSSSNNKDTSIAGIKKFEENLNNVLDLYDFPKTNLASIITSSCYEDFYGLRKDVLSYEKKMTGKEQNKEDSKSKEKYLEKKNKLNELFENINAKLLELNENEVRMDDITEIPTWNSTLLLTSFFLRGLYARGNRDQSKVRMFNKLRMHVFTYFQLPEVEILNNREDVLLDFMRIAHGENSKYNLIIENGDSSKQYIQPFRNVWFASTVEGCAIMTLMPQEAGTNIAKIPNEFSFFKDYENTIEKRYLWIYIWVLLQRHSQLYWIDYLTQINVLEGNRNYSLDVQELQDVILKIQKIKVSSYFTDISDYTHHNRFYQLCKDSLCIGEHFTEIEEKLLPLHEMIRSLKDEKENKENDRRDAFFGVVVACFAIASVAYDGLSYYKEYVVNNADGSWNVKPVSLVIFLMVLVILSWFAANWIVRILKWIRGNK